MLYVQKMTLRNVTGLFSYTIVAVPVILLQLLALPSNDFAGYLLHLLILLPLLLSLKGAPVSCR